MKSFAHKILYIAAIASVAIVLPAASYAINLPGNIEYAVEDCSSVRPQVVQEGFNERVLLLVLLFFIAFFFGALLAFLLAGAKRARKNAQRIGAIAILALISLPFTSDAICAQPIIILPSSEKIIAVVVGFALGIGVGILALHAMRGSGSKKKGEIQNNDQS